MVRDDAWTLRQKREVSLLAPAATSQPTRIVLGGLYQAIEGGHPWNLIRFGEGELLVLNKSAAPLQHVENRVGSSADMDSLYRHTVAALRDADWVGWHQDARLKEQMAARGFLPRIHERSCFAWVNLHMGLRRRFVETIMRMERLFLAGGPMAQWHREVLRPFGLAADAIIYDGPSRLSTAGDAQAVAAAAINSGARIALFSLGIWAPMIAHLCKEAGMIALDWGHQPDHNLHAIRIPLESGGWRIDRKEAILTCTCGNVLRMANDKPPADDQPGQPIFGKWLMDHIVHCNKNGCPRRYFAENGIVWGTQAHWRYQLNVCCPDSPEGLDTHTAHAGVPYPAP